MGREGGKSAIPAFFFAILGLDAGGACAARPRGARCHSVNCVSRETLLQAYLQFNCVNLWCYTYTVIYTFYTRS